MTTTLTLQAEDDIDADGPGAANTGSIAPTNLWTLKAHTAVGGDATTATTSAIDTTGVDLIVIIECNYDLNPEGNASSVSPAHDLTDSKGNVWIKNTTYGNADTFRVSIYYSQPTSVGSGHTFSWNRGGSPSNTYPVLSVLAFSGSAPAASDNENGGGGSSGATSTQPGSLTPTQSGCLVVTGLCAGYPLGSTAAIDSGMALGDEAANSNNNLTGSAAWVEQGTAAAINPTWSWTNSKDCISVIGSFKSA